MEIYDENQNPWFTKDRSETASNRYPTKTLSNGIVVENPGLGLNVYRNVFSAEDSKRYIDILESNLSNGKKYKWSEAQVTNSTTPIKKARDAVDFKYKQENLGPRDEFNAELIDLHEEIYQKSESQDIYTKKELNTLQKKVERSKKIIAGIEKLTYPIGALIVADVQKDRVAVREALRIGVPVIGLVDTNANPEGISIVIPCNDDLDVAIDCVSKYLAQAIREGKEIFQKNNELAAEKAKVEQTLEEKNSLQEIKMARTPELKNILTEKQKTLNKKMTLTLP